MSNIMSKLAPLTLSLLAFILAITPVANAQLTPRTSAGGLFGTDRPQPLRIEAAFPFFVSLNDTGGLSVTWQPATGHYLYKHRFGFALKSTSESAARSINFEVPDGLQKTDQFFGEIEAYYEAVTATLDVDVSKLSDATLLIEYQGCADWGFCYPPQVTEYRLTP